MGAAGRGGSGSGAGGSESLLLLLLLLHFSGTLDPRSGIEISRKRFVRKGGTRRRQAAGGKGIGREVVS